MEGFNMCLGFPATVRNTGKILSPPHHFQLSSLRRDGYCITEMGRRRLLGVVIFLPPPPGFDSSVLDEYSPGEGAMSFIWNR